MVYHRLQTAAPGLVAGFGAALFLVAGAFHLGELLAVESVVGPVIAFGLDGPPALALVYGGYWLARTDLTPEDRWQVWAWCVLGAGVFAGIVGVSILVRVIEGRVVSEALFPLLIAAEAGGIAGVVTGYQTARARRETRRTRAASDALRERTRQLQAVLDGVEAAIWIRDTDGRFVLVNQEFRTAFGIGEEVAVTERRSEELLPSGVVEQFRETDRRVLERAGSVETEETLETADGERTFLTRVAPLFDDGDLYATCGVAIDITEQKQYERTIERQNERLEEFASVVSHDLRNPLTVAGGQLSMAREECDSEHERLDHVERALDRMEALIDDLLTLARGDETELDPEPVELAALARRGWANVETAGATLVTETNRTVYADESRLKQAFENLVRNAVEHGSTGSRREDAGDAAEHGSTDNRNASGSGDAAEHGSTDNRSPANAGHDGGVTVTVGDLDDGFYVADDGPGIPEARRDEIFDAGYSTNEAGTGFGLNIVEQVVDAHGWAIRVTEGSEGGARFEITGAEFADG